MTLIVQPVGAAAISRMPQAMMSLAAWPAVGGLVFLTRSTPLAFNEVVVALLGEPGGRPALQRFAWQLAGWVTFVLAALSLTPLGRLWFESVIGLEPELVDLCSTALLFALPLPAITAFQSWFTGALVHHRSTRAITEAVGLYLAVSSALLVAGAVLDLFPGIHFALVAFVAGALAQTYWLKRRSGSARIPSH